MSNILRGFKKTEIGVIPEDWIVKKLSEIGESIIGLTYNPSHVKPFGTLVLRSSNVQNGKLSFEDNVFVEMDLPKRVIVKENDILICVRNGSRELIGKCALIDKKTAGAAFGAFMSIYRSEVPFFVFHQFQSFIIQRQINGTLGATINQITNKDLASFKVYLPPTKSEQTAIATALNDADALISQLEKLIANKRAIKQGAMQELLRPKEGWVEKKVGEVFKFLGTANNSRAELADGGDFEYIHYGDIHTRWNSFLDCSKNDLPFISFEKIKGIPLLQDGDLIIADASEDYEGLAACVEIKNIGKRKIIAGLHTLLLRGNKNIIADGFKGFFKYYHGVNEALIAASTGVSVYGISKSNLKEIVLILPPVKTQRHIAQILSDMDTEIESLESNLAKYKQIKQGMMQNLLTGKIRLV